MKQTPEYILLVQLGQAVRESQVVSPIIIIGTSHHISLYADDVLLYLLDVVWFVFGL